MSGKRVYLTLTDITVILMSMDLIKFNQYDIRFDVEKEVENLETKLNKAKETIEGY